MPSPDTRSSSPNSSASLTPSTYLNDESAFRRAFDAEFNSALADARSKLGDATTLAPRVVETAFVNVWQQRASLVTHDQFKKTLDDEVHHGAARALSRRAAAHRFGGSNARDEHTMTGTHPATADADPEAAWSRIVRTIHGEGHTADAHREVASATRHEAAAHMKGVAKRPSWVIPVAIGVVALIGALFLVKKLDRMGEDDATLAAVDSPIIQPIASSAGQIGSVTLGDGSKMRIGPETKVFIPDGFPTKMRALRVEGTAEFDVAPNQPMPFRVVANRTHFIATGTKFVVSAYPDDSAAKVFVEEGTVTVKSGKLSQSVAANQAAVADAKGIRAPTADEQAEAFGWVKGQITVQHAQLRHVVATLTRWFNYDVKVPDLPLLDRPASIDVPLDSSRLAISQVEQSANVKFAYEGVTKVFRDAGPKPVTKAAPSKSASKKKR
ncbi:MAG TPA: FecR domain-containing protein [Gemmatimonadaceae bacterium]|jgi:transmembrane sensor|nr:FecR domain-containing protein [Gemmatimonadaceae bacterium]